MKYIVSMMIAACLTGVILWAAAALEFNSTKRLEGLKITDVVITIRVPVVRDGATRPVVPADLRELRKVETISYSDENKVLSAFALVVMIVPAAHVTEFMARAAAHGIQVFQRSDVVAASAEFADGENKLSEMEQKIEYALTPISVFDIK